MNMPEEASAIDVYYDMDIAQICQHFNKSRNTVDKAIAKLVKDNPDKDWKYKNPATRRITIKAEGVDLEKRKMDSTTKAIIPTVIEIDHDSSFSGTCNEAGGLPVIVVNRNMCSERKRLTIFHELGHLLMHCADGVDKEKMCNVFANEVLIPSDKFKNLIGESRHDISLVELQAMQREYGISVDALMVKAAQLNIITDRRFTSYHKKKNALPTFKEAVEQSLYPMEHTCRFERLVYRALASEVISYSKAAALLDKSVNEVRDTLNLM